MIAIRNIRHLIAAVALLLMAGSALADAAMDEEGWFAIRVQDGRVLVPVTINGISSEAVIDSGSEFNAIDQTFVDLHRAELRFGRNVRLIGLYGVVQEHVIDDVTIGMFGSQVTAWRLAPANIAPAGLLLGIPFLRNFVTQIDYPNQRMRLLDSKGTHLAELANVEVHKQHNTTLPMVKVSLDPGEYSWLTLNTGYVGGVFVPREVAEHYGWLDKFVPQRTDGSDGNRLGTGESFRIPFLKIGPFQLENVQVTVPAEGQDVNINVWRPGMNWGVDSAGLVGYDVLKHFVVTVDAGHMKMHLGLPATTTASATDSAAARADTGS
jgi:hypothetical protein